MLYIRPPIDWSLLEMIRLRMIIFVIKSNYQLLCFFVISWLIALGSTWYVFDGIPNAQQYFWDKIIRENQKPR